MAQLSYLHKELSVTLPVVKSKYLVSMRITWEHTTHNTQTNINSRIVQVPSFYLTNAVHPRHPEQLFSFSYIYHKRNVAVRVDGIGYTLGIEHATLWLGVKPYNIIIIRRRRTTNHYSLEDYTATPPASVGVVTQRTGQKPNIA